jgi:predicted PurR-regulated permease PerM
MPSARSPSAHPEASPETRDPSETAETHHTRAPRVAAPPPAPPSGLTFRRTLALGGIAGALVLAYVLRGVLVPLFLAFLLAYALDPFVDKLEAMRVPRPLAAILVVLGIATVFTLVLVFAIPLFMDELREAGAELPAQLRLLEARVEPWLYSTFKVRIPHSMGDVSRAFGDRIQSQIPTMLNAVLLALFGTLSYVAVAMSALIVPVFALYLLIDFDRIVVGAGKLVPRRWIVPVSETARQVHRALSGWVRGQLTANLVLGALYAAGLRLVDVRLAVPIGVLTGMLAFVPYIGFATGLLLALAMATLDWQGPGHLLAVVGVMGTVQILDGLVITPRIVGRSVGLAPLEVLVTMMAAASLFGFLGVLLAVPLGAVVKILVQRIVRAYMRSDFYLTTTAKPPRSPE